MSTRPKDVDVVSTRINIVSSDSAHDAGSVERAAVVENTKQAMAEALLDIHSVNCDISEFHTWPAEH